MLVKKAYKFRIYPNETQKDLLESFFGHCRFVYNHFLDHRTKLYKETGRSSSYSSMCRELTQLKKEKEWLKEAPAQSLQQSLKDLDSAFNAFFRGQSGYPTFKKKNHKQSCRFPQGYRVRDKHIRLPKLGWIKLIKHRKVPNTPTSVTLTKAKSGKYFVSLVVEEEIPHPSFEGEEVGIDLGLKRLMTLSNGDVVKNPGWFRQQERKVARLNRALSRKEKYSNNWHKARRRLARAREKISNQRKDFYHKLSRNLVEEYGTIYLEDLNMANMSRSLRLGKSVHDAGLGMFQRFLEYKGSWYGCHIVKIDRWFPSSKTCNECGFINDSLRLSDRTWTCDCGATLDRDLNAARNILEFGIRLGRPKCKPVDRLKSGTKQEAHRL